MKAVTLRSLSMLLLVILCAAEAGAQESSPTPWQIMPGVSLVKYFPGSSISEGSAYGGGPIILIYPGPGGEFRYAATGLSFQARCFNERFLPLALTFGAGVAWFYDADKNQGGVVPMSATDGVGRQIKREDFTVFPVSVGLQAVFPFEQRERLMLFAGVEGTLNLVSGDVPLAQQAKLGYSLVGGFAVKIFEFGVRYMEFSDLRNLGAYFGFRLNSFTL